MWQNLSLGSKEGPPSRGKAAYRHFWMFSLGIESCFWAQLPLKQRPLFGGARAAAAL